MKRKKQPDKSGNALERFTRMPADGKRRLLLKGAVGLGVLGVAAGAISDYDNKQRELHDLSTVGAGDAVVVQVHDTTCPICRSLKTVTSKVLVDYQHIHFRVADMATTEGRAFQQKYGASKTTLLFFDGRGKLLDTVVGAQTCEDLERLLARHYPPSA